MSITVAAVDCGTNSVRLLVLRRESDGTTVELARETELARLGQGVDETGEFHPDALKRTFAIFDNYQEIIASHGAERTRLVATSAARDVSNRDAFFDGVRQRFGIDADVISGEEEAHLSTVGVLSGVEVAAPLIIIDIGGGSTELVVVEKSLTVSASISLQIGAVRVTERFLHADPRSDQEVASARAYIGERLDESGVDFSRFRTAIGVAGTVTTFAARELGLSEYDRLKVHETKLSREQISEATAHWLATPVAQIMQEPIMPELRAQVMGGGSLILDEFAARVPDGEVLVSATDILDGIALGLLEG